VFLPFSSLVLTVVNSSSMGCPLKAGALQSVEDLDRTLVPGAYPNQGSHDTSEPVPWYDKTR